MVRSQLPKPVPDCQIGALSGSGKPDFASISACGRRRIMISLSRWANQDE